MATLTDYRPPVKSETDADKVRVKPSDLVGALLVLHVRGVKESVKTSFSPEGKDAIILDVASVKTGNVAPDQMWFNGAIVDGLRPYVGATIAAKLEFTKGQSGRPYLVIAPVDETERTQAAEFLDSNPDLFEDSLPSTTTVEEIGETPGDIGRW